MRKINYQNNSKVVNNFQNAGTFRFSCLDCIKSLLLGFLQIKKMGEREGEREGSQKERMKVHQISRETLVRKTDGLIYRCLQKSNFLGCKEYQMNSNFVKFST